MWYGRFMHAWRRPSYEEEAAEFERTSDELGIDLGLLQEAFRNGELVDLESWVWCILENTDSCEVFTIAETEAKAELYSRDIARIFVGMARTDVFPAPIILTQPHHRPYLISGNTRLMACRVLNIRPKVLMVSVS